MNRPRCLGLLALASAAFPFGGASAQVASAAEIVERVCSDRIEEAKPRIISLTRLAEETLRSNQVYLDDLAPSNGTILQKIRNLRTIVSSGSETVAGSRIVAAQTAIKDLEAELQKKTFDALTVTKVNTSTPGWLFSEASELAVFTCKLAKTKPPLAILAAPPGRDRFALREKPEDLGLTGKDRKAASAFAFSVEKKWSTDDQGVETDETTLNFDGTAGLRVTPDESPAVAYVYAQYDLDQTRRDPAAPLGPDERRNAGDTNVLALGLSFDYFHYRGDNASFWLTAQSAYVNDFVDESERVRVSTKLDPGFNAPLGVCNIGSIRNFGNSRKIGARCLVRLDGEAGLWLKDGLSTTRSYDDFVAIGASVAYEVFYETSEKTGVVASVNYRYLPVLTGSLNDIERFEFALGQRIWTEGNLGIEVLARYNNGTNPLSLVEEEDLSIGIGLIF